MDFKKQVQVQVYLNESGGPLRNWKHVLMWLHGGGLQFVLFIKSIKVYKSNNKTMILQIL